MGSHIAIVQSTLKSKCYRQLYMKAFGKTLGCLVTSQALWTVLENSLVGGYSNLQVGVYYVPGWCVGTAFPPKSRLFVRHGHRFLHLLPQVGYFSGQQCYHTCTNTHTTHTHIHTYSHTHTHSYQELIKSEGPSDLINELLLTQHTIIITL